MCCVAVRPRASFHLREAPPPPPLAGQEAERERESE
jgi:hypothetical protein